MSERQRMLRRVRTVRKIRHSSELEGSRSTDATRADQFAYAKGAITAAELGDRVRQRHNIAQSDAGDRRKAPPGPEGKGRQAP